MFGGFEHMFGQQGGFHHMGGESAEPKEVENEKLYELLGVEKDATTSQLKKAFFKKARKEHPDKGGDAKKFQEISAAYDILKDEKKRKVYDTHGMEGIKEGRGKGGDPSDIFSQFFGGGGGGRQQPQQRKAKGMKKECEVTLEEVYMGGTKNFMIKRYRPCVSCDGQGGDSSKKCGKCKGRGRLTKMVQLGPGMYQQSQVHCPECKGEGEIIKNKCKKCKGEKIYIEEKLIQAPIQVGVYEGYDYVLTGEGHETPGVYAGDLHVFFRVKKHRLFERKGADLYITKKITLLEALTGFTMSITHLDKKTLKIATMPGEVISHEQTKMIRGKGMPFFEDEMSFGNLFIKFDVQMPQKGFIKGKNIDLLGAILPGSQYKKIDYKEKKYEILDEYDETNFNTNPKGEEANSQQQRGGQPGQGQRVECQQS